VVQLRGLIGGPWAISGLRPLVTRPAELFVIYQLLKGHLFSALEVFEEEIAMLISSLIYIQVSHVLLTFKP
jgi:hypothetical protein